MPDAPDLPSEHDAVRRLLAEARHDGATPPEVVARLDETLAGLVADRTPGTPLPTDTPGSHARDGEGEGAPVVDLAARRRRRVGVGLLAAAAVAVAGVAIGQGLPTTSGSDDSAASGSAGGSDLVQEEGADGSSSQDSSSGALSAPEAKSQGVAPNPAPTLSAADAGLADTLLALRPGARPRASTFSATDSCPLPRTGPGRTVQVEVDGAAGVVVYRRPAGREQDVAVYVCGTSDPVRTLTLPAP